MMPATRIAPLVLIVIALAGSVGAQEVVKETESERAEVSAASVLAPGSQIENMSAPLLRMALSLMAVLALVALCAWLARRLRSTQLQGGLIQIVSGLSLGPKEKVVLLRVGEEEILVGLSQAGLQPLHVLGESATPQKFSLKLGDTNEVTDAAAAEVEGMR